MREMTALFMLALALGSDAFSVAVCVGLAGANSREKLRLACGFGAFQFIMPITGLLVGTVFGKFVGDFAAYIGGGLLVVLGVAMIWRTLSQGFHCPPLIHRSFFALIAASVGVSLDALAVGVGIGLGARRMGIGIVPASTVIGAVAFLMTAIGIEVGGHIGTLVQHRAPIVGGGILIGIGVLVLFGVL